MHRTHAWWAFDDIASPDGQAIARATQRQSRLTKPAGALGDLEQLAITLAGHQGRECPQIAHPHAIIFAADHGVAAQGVSAYPPSVTAQMVLNFLRGGAAISVLSALHGARLTVVDVGVNWSLSGLNPPDPTDDGVFARNPDAPAGSACFTSGPAMTADQLSAALQAGVAQSLQVVQRGGNLLMPGEMGIGNTTSATAVACALLGLPAVQLTGRGTGISDAVHAHKCSIIQQALDLHAPVIAQGDVLTVLRCLGGLEIAALTAAILTAAQRGVTVLVDGFIVSVAALVACRLQPACRDWMLFAHQSAEAGHNAVLSAMNAKPLMNLGLRLGEGSGAAVALPLLQMACALHAGMATFDGAGVSTRHVGEA